MSFNSDSNVQKPDPSPVELPFAEMPHSDLLTSLLDGPTNCERLFDGSIQPPVPFGNQTEAMSLLTEQGFKSVRGQCFSKITYPQRLNQA